MKRPLDLVVLEALVVVERLQYGYDSDAGKMGLYDPVAERFVAHVPDGLMDLRPFRAKVIIDAIHANEGVHA